MVAIINRSDLELAAHFTINAVCCVAILAIGIGNVAATPSAWSTQRLGRTFAWRREDGGPGRSRRLLAIGAKHRYLIASSLLVSCPGSDSLCCGHGHL